MRDGVALSWELGSRGGMGAGIKMKRGRGQGARKRVGFGDGRPGRPEK